MTAAAITRPTPNSPVRLVPAARAAAAIFLRVSRIAASTPRRSSVSLAASCLHRVGRCERFQDAPSLACGDLPGHAAGNQLAQHLVQPAGHLGAGPPGPAGVPHGFTNLGPGPARLVCIHAAPAMRTNWVE